MSGEVAIRQYEITNLATTIRDAIRFMVSLFHASFPPCSTATLFIGGRVPNIPTVPRWFYIFRACELFVQRPPEDTEHWERSE